MSSSSDAFFKPEDMISFKEENKNKWSGPAKGIGVDGKVFIVKYGNNMSRIHKTKAAKKSEEFLTKQPTNDQENKEIFYGNSEEVKNKIAIDLNNTQT